MLVRENKSIDLVFASTSNPYASGTVSIAKAGYTPIAVVGFVINGTGSSVCYVSSLTVYLSNNNLTYAVRSANVVSSTTGMTLGVAILYLKNS